MSSAVRIPASAEPSPTGTVNILLVDDQPSRLTTYETILAPIGERLVAVSSGREALQFLLHNEAAVILLDVNMPEMDGFETAAMIRDRPRLAHTPIVFVSAINPSDMERLRAYDFGAIDFVFVPIVPEILRAKVSVLVKLHRQQIALVEMNRSLELATERLRCSELALQQKAGELERSNLELERFAHIASHDLQEPLRMISSYIQLLARRYSDLFDEDATEFMGFVVDGASRMQRLINDLFDYSRVGSLGPAPARVSSSIALAHAAANLASMIADTGALVTREELPVVLADEGQLTQLFQNLVSNAIKFRAKGVVPRIRISATIGTDQAVFSVRDNGIGIPADCRGRLFVIFQRFVRGDEYPGSGVGLAICKRIVERHDGRIWMEPLEEGGSDFRFTLPLAAALKEL